MTTVFVHSNGETRRAERIDPAWLSPGSGVTIWVDLASATETEARAVLVDAFHFHPLSVEDALSVIHHPKIESYDSYLYLILHGIDANANRSAFATRDVDFFLGSTYLVTVHDGQSRSVEAVKALCGRHEHVLAEGPVALLHRIVDVMVDNYRPEIDALDEQMNHLEEEAILGQRPDLVRQILMMKRNLSSLRRVLIPQRDAVGRLARREFPLIDDEMTYRFRDVYDNLVRLSEDAILFQDRVTGILEAHLSSISNRLNQVMKVLTVMSTIFLPLTVLTGMWGMNVPLPKLAGGDAAQFWWMVGAMATIIVGMLVVFRRKGWM